MQNTMVATLAARILIGSLAYLDVDNRFGSRGTVFVKMGLSVRKMWRFTSGPYWSFAQLITDRSLSEKIAGLQVATVPTMGQNRSCETERFVVAGS